MLPWSKIAMWVDFSKTCIDCENICADILNKEIMASKKFDNHV